MAYKPLNLSTPAASFNFHCSTSIYCYTHTSIPLKKAAKYTVSQSRIRAYDLVSTRVCSSVEGPGTNRPRFKVKCEPCFSGVATNPSKITYKRGFECFETEKYRKWRCQQSNRDQSRVLHKRRCDATTTYPDKSIFLRRILDIRWRARVRLLGRYARKWSFLTIFRVWLKSLQKNWRQIGLLGLMLSLIGVSFLYLRVTAASAPQEVPYSNLVSYLKAGRVTSALFEEGSRLIYFNVAGDSDNAMNLRADRSSVIAEGSQNLGLPFVEHGRAEKDGYLAPGDSTQAGGVISSEATKSARETEDDQEGNQSLDTLIEQPQMLQKYPVSEEREAKGWQAIKVPSKAWHFATRRIKYDEGFLLGLMRDSRVTYSSAPQSVSATLRTLLITILTLWIPLSPLLFLLHRQLSMNSSSSRKRKKQALFVKFDDVAGVDAAKEELMEIVSCLKGASTFKSLGAKLPKGILLVGPPGTGKTLLARAVASEAGVPFFAASASEFVEMFVGRGAARVRDLFAGARKCSPSIVFVDEIDAVGGKRGRSFNDERDQTLNQLLTELDGFESEMGVVVIAATNRPESLDPALCRPGRFSRKVFVKEPDFLGRCQILAVHMRGIPVAEDAEIIQRAIASSTPGFVGADLANIVNEAAMLAARQGHSTVNLADFREATNRVKYGVGDVPKIAILMESEISRWFGWISPRSRISEASRGVQAIPTSS
ncbi:hypothetical protein O6H91_05G029500 [Diphasiastrum complanatum]|uniref:Uncharacterized protein n=1 Tax=Diphasiastrum complanatum TaxID=34168 RepID=A0ACC2DM43_DIPCM|nr:hypothetical protein O6H91_Y383900 [Diphasiastrum complanatum]KAJ7555276.1 hypothetical protein O6H91_05G029500 [Diphasiastrum complanatum]